MRAHAHGPSLALARAASAELPSVLAVAACDERGHRFIGRPRLLLRVRGLGRLAPPALEHALNNKRPDCTAPRQYVSVITHKDGTDEGMHLGRGRGVGRRIRQRGQNVPAEGEKSYVPLVSMHYTRWYPAVGQYLTNLGDEWHALMEHTLPLGPQLPAVTVERDGRSYELNWGVKKNISFPGLGGRTLDGSATSPKKHQLSRTSNDKNKPWFSCKHIYFCRTTPWTIGSRLVGNR